MVSRAPHSGALFRWIGPIVLACLVVCPARAGDNVQVVPLGSDGRGNQAWVEFDSAGGRTKATPFVGGDGVKKLLQNQDEKGALAVPVPRLMRLIERARQALRDMKSDGAKPQAGPDAAKPAAAQTAATIAGPRKTAPRPPDSLAPPQRTGAAIHPPATLFSAAGR